MHQDLTLRVARRRMLTPYVCELQLVDVSGGELPGFAPGAHLTVQTPSGARRSYSLTGSSEDRSRYVIAVRREPRGRGGSRSMVDDVVEGNHIAAQFPTNAFELVASERYVLIAGGIGITPIRSMLQHLRGLGTSDVHVVYLTRSREDTPYLDELGDPTLAEVVTIHHDDENGLFDLWPLLAQPRDDTRVYCCGPAPLMDAVEALTVHWRASRIHFERFSGVDALGLTATPFTAIWQPSGECVNVPADKTLLDALRAARLPVEGSCESGTCGTCRLRLLAGEAEHRDLVLTNEETSSAIMPCVSRAASPQIVIAP